MARLLLALFLVGCGEYNIKQERVEATVILRDEVKFGGRDACGFAYWDSKKCIIVIKRDSYPRCLEHELRHCFEGKFHR